MTLTTMAGAVALSAWQDHLTHGTVDLVTDRAVPGTCLRTLR